MRWLPRDQKYSEEQRTATACHRAISGHHTCSPSAAPCQGPSYQQPLFPGISSPWSSAVLSPVGTSPLAPIPAQLFSHRPEAYSSLPSIPTTSLLLRQDRTAETSRFCGMLCLLSGCSMRCAHSNRQKLGSPAPTAPTHRALFGLCFSTSISFHGKFARASYGKPRSWLGSAENNHLIAQKRKK